MQNNASRTNMKGGPHIVVSLQSRSPSVRRPFSSFTASSLKKRHNNLDLQCKWNELTKSATLATSIMQLISLLHSTRVILLFFPEKIQKHNKGLWNLIIYKLKWTKWMKSLLNCLVATFSKKPRQVSGGSAQLNQTGLIGELYSFLSCGSSRF